MRSIGSLWHTDRGLTALLLFLFVTLLVAPPLISARLLSPVFLDVFFSLILVSGAAAVSGRRWPTIVAAGLAAVTLGLRWLRVGTHDSGLSVVDAGLTAFTFLTLAALVLFQVLRQGSITLYRVQGAVAAYLLLGLAWAGAYELVVQISPGAFRPPEEVRDPMALLYYSFVTLTTMGYGDITPVLPAARSLAISEALVGQLFPAVLIARLVSMELADRSLRPGGDRRHG
jgi:Ion channel